MSFRIRPAVAGDVDQVHHVHSAAVLQGSAEHYSPASLQAWVGAFNPETFPRNLDRMDFWVAELPDGRVAGFATLNPETGELDSLYTAPWGLGRGIGTELLRTVEEAARARAIGSIWLDASLNAVSFYERFGWKEVERHARVRHGIEIPVVKMEKRL